MPDPALKLPFLRCVVYFFDCELLEFMKAWFVVQG